MPALAAKAVDGSRFNLHQHLKNRVTLVTISYSAFSAGLLDSFRTPWLSMMANDRRLGLVGIEPITGWLRWALFACWNRMALQKSLPAELQKSHVVVRGTSRFRDTWQIPNVYGGYLALVDGEGRRRWTACGSAAGNELALLEQHAQTLLFEIK